MLIALGRILYLFFKFLGRIRDITQHHKWGNKHAGIKKQGISGMGSVIPCYYIKLDLKALLSQCYPFVDERTYAKQQYTSSTYSQGKLGTSSTLECRQRIIVGLDVHGLNNKQIVVK